MQYQPAEKRYEVKPDWFRRCGRSGLMLPAISLGLWHNFGAAGTDAALNTSESDLHENCRSMIFTSFDLGITHFDLANNYGPPPGAAESRFGKILREDLWAYRDELIISSKAGYRMWPGPYGEWGSRKYLLASLDQSLKRMQIDYVDIFYSHRPDPHTPLDETLGALDSAVKSGKAIYAGISSYSGPRTKDVADMVSSQSFTKPIIHQPVYSMLNRWVEKELIPQTDAAGMGTIAFCPLAQGLLTGKYLKGIPQDSRAKQPDGFLKENQITPELVAKLNKLNGIAQSRGQSLAQLALQWVLRPQGQTGITSALIGASRASQVVENVKALSFGPITAEELTKIEQILA
jgi:L-glyceraldehyde 3-phosphate reductase